MTSKIKRTWVLCATLAVAGVFALSGCSATAPAQTTSSDEPAAMSSSPEAGSADEKMRDFVTAVYANTFTTTEEMVSPGSAAAKYVIHQKSTDTALKANGDYTEPGTADQPTLEFKDGTATAKYSDGTSFTWSEFEYDDDGLVVSWTTPSGKLPSLLWSTDFSGAIAGNTVALTSAYKTNSGEMRALLTVTAGGEGIDFMMPYQAQFVASDGIAYAAQSFSAPRQSLPAGVTGYVVLAFPQVPFGGTIYLEGYNIGSPDVWKAEIPVS